MYNASKVFSNDRRQYSSGHMEIVRNGPAGSTFGCLDLLIRFGQAKRIEDGESEHIFIFTL